MRVLKPINSRCLFRIEVLLLIAVMFGGPGLKTQTPPSGSGSLLAKNGVVVDSSGTLRIKYTLSHYDSSAGQFVDSVHETTVDPRRSALVVVDIWEADYLDTMVIYFINPLIKELNRLGVKIVYAPSQRDQNSNLFILDDTVIFHVHDVMDDFLRDNQIESLFYVGFDTYYCILDKPNGIYSYRMRTGDPGMRILLFEEGVISFTREMKETAISLFKKHDVGIIESDYATYNHRFPRMTITDIFAKTVERADSGKTFVMIYRNDRVNDSLSQLETFLKENNVDFGVVYKDTLIVEAERLTNIDEFVALLKQLEIKNIYYCGYHLNDEIMWNQFGIIPLYIKKRYGGLRELPEYYVINDLSYIIPSSSIDPELEKAVVINHYRDLRNILSATLTEGLR